MQALRLTNTTGYYPIKEVEQQALAGLQNYIMMEVTSLEKAEKKNRKC